MSKYFFVAFFSFICVQFTNAASPIAVDSVGTVVRNGKSFIVHKVAPKETMYGLARQYGVPVAEVQRANPGLSALVVGQTIYVPGRASTSASVPATGTTASAAPETTSPAAPAVGSNETGNRQHQVTARQTLYAIARQYNVSPADIKKWNNLTSDNLQEGQILMVSAPTAGMAATPNVAAPVAAEEAETPPVAKPAPRREEVKPVATLPAPEKESTPVKVERTETRVSESLSRISESGLAEVMDKGEGSKYLALHKTAPVGTILQVKNSLNNQSVYVRVSGKLPESSSSDRVIIRLSKRAYQKLAATASRFQVEINYMP